MLNGRVYTPPLQPAMTSASPWWAAVVTLGQTNDQTLNVNTIANTFRDQFGLFKPAATNRIDIALRFQRVSVWNLTVGRSMRVCFHGIVSGTYDRVLEDWSAPQRMARCGYEWPLADRTFPVDDASTKTVFKVDVPSTAAWIAYCYILWRPTVQSSITRNILDAARMHSLGESFEQL